MCATPTIYCSKNTNGRFLKICWRFFKKSQRCVFQIHLDGVITTCVSLTELASLSRLKNNHNLKHARPTKFWYFQLQQFQICLPCAHDVRPKSSRSDFWFFHLDKFQPEKLGNLTAWKKARFFITSSLCYDAPLPSKATFWDLNSAHIVTTVAPADV